MAILSFDVQRYTIWLGPGLGFSNLQLSYPAFIICWADKKYRCTFRFVDRPELPESRYSSDSGTADVFVHAAQYPWYVDLLRNERPVTCSINTTNPGFTYLSTGPEPTGEAEQVIRV